MGSVEKTLKEENLQGHPESESRTFGINRCVEDYLSEKPYVCMYVRTYVCMYVCMYVRTYVCMYVCMSNMDIAFYY